MLGYDSYNPVLNLGTLSIVMMFFIFQVLFLVIFIQPFRKKPCGKKLCKKIGNRLLFGELFTILIEGFIEICLTGALMMNV